MRRRDFLRVSVGTGTLAGLAPALLAMETKEVPPASPTPAGIKFAICNEIFKDWKFEDVAAFAAKTGYDAIEIAPYTFADSVTKISAGERRRIRDIARRNNLAVAGIHWLLVKPEGLSINNPDRTLQERTAQYLCDLVDFCADIGGTIMVFGSPKQRDVLPGVSHQQAWDWAAETFRRPVARAEERAVTLCLEPLSSANTNFINTAADAIRFIKPFNSARFKIILDTYAMCAESKPVPQIIKESSPHFAHYHANDRNLKGPGFGDVDFQPIAAALHATGYAGYVSVEVFNFDEGAERIAVDSLKYLRQMFK